MKNLLTFLAMSIIVGAGSVQAQNVGLSVTPARHEIIAKPGSDIALVFDVKNEGDPVYVKTGVGPFASNDANGTVKILPASDTDIRITSGSDEYPLEKTLFLGSKENIRIPVDVEIPENLKETDYYYAFYVQSEPPPGTEGGISLRVQQRIISQMYITVTRTGIVEVKPKIALFTVSPQRELYVTKDFRLVDSGESIPVLLTVANNGGSAFSMNGSLITTLPFNSSSVRIPDQRVLASSTKIVELPPVSGAFFGPVTLALELNYGESGVKNYSTVTFFAAPFRYWPAAVTALLIPAVLILTQAGRRKH